MVVEEELEMENGVVLAGMEVVEEGELGGGNLAGGMVAVEIARMESPTKSQHLQVGKHNVIEVGGHHGVKELESRDTLQQNVSAVLPFLDIYHVVGRHVGVLTSSSSHSQLILKRIIRLILNRPSRHQNRRLLPQNPQLPTCGWFKSP